MSVITSDQFDGPGSASGISWEELKGKLLLITPLSVETVSTSFGEKEAARARVVVLDADQGSDSEYPDTLVFPRALLSQIRSNVGTGRMNLGRLGQGQAKAGQKPPWLLQDPSDQDKTIARAWLAQNQAVPF